MATRTFASFEKDLAPSVPGCPLPTVIQYVRAAAIEACERTQAYRYQQEDIPLTPGVHEYSYEVPDQTEVCGVLYAALDGIKIPFVPQEEVHRKYPDWPVTSSTNRSQPTVVSQFDVDNFVVAPVPDRPTSTTLYQLRMFLALRPTTTATGMDQTILDELERPIIDGALQRLLVLPNKSWTDRQLAQYHAKQFVFKIASHRAKANLGLGHGSIHVRIPTWA
ncbi:MAG: hypothetical protein KDA17_07295 [Candidatus Saccharibacteria bacterium]|nr:hypothetical protein [Candidatus Saccharibacteria bacterium]